ncbi:hypothetical protein A3D06_00045 [Candidatus Roizmanbacteria bacterium RIFCSPHIGHO2_02_FULL_40_9]|uniref:Uncharacterized protein n=1 Tax=Candidatus Roizmanbacteria bacterium RIFCSPHIGHO2_02_FULL_40_9 TaxID=1802042 RepID=A0A1F7HEH8_9BACT|nr:MAG: hypothetical protein A3D06_00045 [Candidatus Roizmanbacteria bacterium RIFCSPHIGHO2_02_FULL_40_9]
MGKKEQGFVEKVFKISNLVSIGVLAFAIITANNVLAMASAVDFTGNVVSKQVYDDWKKKRGKKK